MERSTIRAILIGGPSGAGKTTLGEALAARLGMASLTVDDLVVAARGVTTEESHPGLWAMVKGPWHEYFTRSSLEELAADATLRHEATWPMVRALIRRHASGAGRPIGFDGWHIRPSYVAGLDRGRPVRPGPRDAGAARAASGRL